MHDLLLKQNIQVSAEQDRVVLSVGRLDIRMPYAASFKIAQGFRLACRHAMTCIGEPLAGWRLQSALQAQPAPLPPVSDQKRTTINGRFNWSVSVDGELVNAQFGNTTVRLHFNDALKVAEWLRVAGEQAKAWAGDPSRHINAAGWLTAAR